MAFSLLARFSLLALPLASALSVSRQIQLEDVDYFVPPEAAWNLDAWNSKDVNGTDEFVPLSAITLNGTANAQRVRAMLEAYNTTDDVWTPSFSQVLYIQAPSQQPENDSWTSDLAPDYDVSSVYYSSNSSSTVPSGPYLVERSTGDVYQAYRLYVDTNQAFLQSTYQDPSGKHHTVHAASSSAGGLTIAVPSRLYFTPTKKQPLAGVRLAVKDLFDLDGVKTSGGNRALYAMSDVKNETAVPVQKLIDAGAIVIGKNKLSEFAFAGPYVTEHIDYLLPFNPRGDGYNSPGDSSGGSAASIASYDWLDVSMGSDTGGSVRGPASNNGVFGNRPTHGAVNLNGSLVLSSSMDTAGLIARDPIVWSEVSKVLYSGLANYREFPTQIYVDPSALQYLSEAEDQYPDLVETAEKFIDALSTLISGNASVFSIDQAWNETAPSTLGNASLAGLVNAIYGNLTRYEQWFEFGQDFVESYMSTHDGDFPHMVPGTRQGWLQANATMTEQSHADDLEYKQSISDWVDASLFPSDNQSCSNAIYLYFTFPNVFKYKVDVSDDSSNPYISDLISSNQQQSMTILQLNATINCNTTLGSQEACDEVLKIIEESEEQTSAPSPVSPGRLASVAGLPDFALTLTSLDLGELTYSNSTLQNQSLPLAVDIVAGKGCDFMLFNLIEKMNEEGIIRKVNTGPIP